MFPEAVRIVLLQYSIQAILALIIMLILRKFHRQYQNEYFQFWSLSWMAFSINMLGSAISLANAFLFTLNHPFRLITSVITIVAGFIQLLWLFMGSYELSRNKKFNSLVAKIIGLCIIPIAIVLVMGFYSDSDTSAGPIRIFLRVGIKSFFAGIIFIGSAIFLAKMFRTGIGIKFIMISFLLYGLLQFNFFIVSIAEIYEHDYAAHLPYFMGDVDLFLQCLMGLGMIISVLEIEQDNLKKANNELDTFLYRSSHDLRAPLTTISGIVQVLKYEKNEEKKDDYLNLIDERVDQADNVIKDIITLRKGQKLSLNIKEIDFEKEIVKEFDLLKSPIKKCQISSLKSKVIKSFKQMQKDYILFLLTFYRIV
jgi:signal transduction histidine kinase